MRDTVVAEKVPSVDALVHAIDWDSFDERANYELGREYARQGEHMQAAAQFRRTVELNPDYAEAWLALGDAYEQVGVAKEATAAWQTALGVARRIGDQRTVAVAHQRLGVEVEQLRQ